MQAVDVAKDVAAEREAAHHGLLLALGDWRPDWCMGAPGLYHPCILMGARGGIMVNASKVKVTLSGSCAQDANKRRKVTLADMLDCIKDGSPWYCHNQ